MQKTETYQFNLIEGSDAFSQEPINENTKAMEAILAGLPKIQTGSYTGTGSFGEDNPNTITFDFVPKVVIFDLECENYYAALPYIWGGKKLSVLYSYETSTGGYSSLFNNNRVTVEGSTMSWYAEKILSGGQTVQLNTSGQTYRWVAMG